LELLEAALCHDDARIDALAAAGGEGEVADPHALRVLRQMPVLPLRQACCRHLASELPASWWEGYCPLRASCTVVAAYSGLERKYHRPERPGYALETHIEDGGAA